MHELRNAVEHVAWLEARAGEEIASSRLVAYDGTTLSTLDGQGDYGALWTRDFAYITEHAKDLMMPGEMRAAIAYLLREQRPDGCVPDRVQSEGTPVYSVWRTDAPPGDLLQDSQEGGIYVCVNVGYRKP